MKACLAQGYTPNPDHARQALRELPYGHWRDYNPEDTVRFYACVGADARLAAAIAMTACSRIHEPAPGAKK